jgi:hypothetical protein
VGINTFSKGFFEADEPVPDRIEQAVWLCAQIVFQAFKQRPDQGGRDLSKKRDPVLGEGKAIEGKVDVARRPTE